MDDNPQYLWAQTQNLTSPTSPEFIYFDENDEEEEPEELKILKNTRLIITKIIEAAGKDSTRLHAFMCLFAGLSLREAGSICGISHEKVRLEVLKIKDTHTHLYQLLTSKRWTVESLIPRTSKKWKIENTKTGRIYTVDKLTDFCETHKYNYNSVKSSVSKNGKYNIYNITKMGD